MGVGLSFLSKSELDPFGYPSRSRDLEDIRALVRAQRGQLSMGEAREYFAMFDCEGMLNGLLDEIAG